MWGDGLALPPSLDAFDRIIAHGVLDPVPEGLTAHLAEGGLLVCAGTVSGAQAIVRIAKREGDALEETALAACALQPILPGLAATL